MKKQQDKRTARGAKKTDRAEIILPLFREFPNNKFSLKQLASASGGASKEGRRETLEILGRLFEEGIVEACAREKDRLTQKHLPHYEGIADMTAGGSIYVRVEGLDDDIFVNQRNTANALDGDRVEVVVVHRGRNGQFEGEITRIVERNRKPYVGIAEVGAHQIFVKADSRRMPMDIYLPKRDCPDVRDGETSIRVRRYDAKMVLPLTWDEDGTSECAFCTRVTAKGKQAVQLQMHIMDDETGTYHIRTKVWRDGKPLDPASLGIIEDFDTLCAERTFCLLSPAIDNTVQDTSPYGVSVFHDAIDAMRMLDTAWTALYDETDLLRAVLMIPDTMIDVETEEDGSKRAVPFGSREQRLYRLTSASIGEEGKPYAFAPAMRTDAIHGVYADACAALGDECGFGSQYFKPDKAGGLKTATEVSSDNSALMRNIRNHENALGKELGRLLTALCECARIHCGAPVEEGFEPVEVVWDDSIITDTSAEKAQMMAEVAAGIVPKWMYLVRFYGMSEEDAQAAMPEQTVLDTGF